jgi:hypothetical protein
MQADTYQRSVEAVHFDDFLRYLAADYTVTKGTGGTLATVVAAGLANGGWLNIPTAASAANDYQSVSSLFPVIEYVAKSPVHAEARLLITESAAQLTSWYFGLVDTLTTGFLASTGLPPASWRGAVFFKTKTSDAIQFRVSNGTAKSTNTNVGTFVSGTPFTLGIQFDPGAGVTGTVKPEINGNSDTPTLTPIPALSFLLSGMGPLYLSTGIVTSTTAAETLAIDYWGVESYRL